MLLFTITFGCRVPGGAFLPALIIGAVTGRIIGLVMQYLTLTYPTAWPFTACAEDLATRGECVIPGVYAIVGAAAGLTGVTRTTVSLVVIMFELTYSLTYTVVSIMKNCIIVSSFLNIWIICPVAYHDCRYGKISDAAPISLRHMSLTKQCIRWRNGSQTGRLLKASTIC